MDATHVTFHEEVCRGNGFSNIRRSQDFDPVLVSASRQSSKSTRYVLSDALVKSSTILSGWNPADLIPSTSSEDTIVLQEAQFAKRENYFEHPKGCSEAVKWLTLITVWALQEGLSPISTKQIVEEHLDGFKHYITENSATWEDFVHVFFTRHKIGGATQFVQWYKRQREIGRNTWFSFEELQRATNNFSRALKCGEGKSGLVFKGIEQFSEQFIAVKRLKKVTEGSVRKVLYEVAINSFIKNSLKIGQFQALLVNLIGFCPCQTDPLLVFEFIPNGNLRQHLQGHFGKHLYSHPSDKVHIAIDVANALKHLHFNCESSIIHRDVKSTNVLLDNRYRARLADLSNAKILGWSPEHSIKSETTPYSMANIFGCSADDAVVGSPGYSDPVFQETRQWSALTDVYSFGVVLLELATHLKAWDSGRPMHLLTDFVTYKVRSGNLSEILLAKAGTTEGEVLKEMLFLGLDCCSFDLTSRPRIDEVERVLGQILSELELSLQLEQGCIRPSCPQNWSHHSS